VKRFSTFQVLWPWRTKMSFPGTLHLRGGRSLALFTGKNRKRFFRDRACVPVAKSAVFAACLVA